MSERTWRTLSWVWQAIALTSLALTGSSVATWGTLLASVVSYAAADILKAIERTNPPQPVVKGAREKA